MQIELQQTDLFSQKYTPEFQMHIEIERMGSPTKWDVAVWNAIGFTAIA